MGPAHLVTAGQMNKNNWIDGRSLTVGCDRSSRAQTPPTAIPSQFLKSPASGRGPDPSLRAEARGARGLGAERAWEAPHTARSEERRSLPSRAAAAAPAPD